jgi:hypothetical protein
MLQKLMINLGHTRLQCDNWHARMLESTTLSVRILSQHACRYLPALVPSPLGARADAVLVARDYRSTCILVTLRLRKISTTIIPSHSLSPQMVLPALEQQPISTDTGDTW